MNKEPVEVVKERYEAALMSLPNVVAVGIGDEAGRRVVKVFVSRKLPRSELAPEDIVPESIEGHEIAVEEIGAIEAETT